MTRLGRVERRTGGCRVESSVLFVCAANVCRSPLMQFVFTDLTAKNSDAGDWRIRSAGAQVGGKHRLCAVVNAMLVRTGHDRDDLARHRSVPIGEELIEDSQLIITASLAERSAVARTVPRARDRTFTLREAIALSETPLEVGDLTSFATELNDRRAYGMLPTARRTFWGGSAHPLDITDDHSSRASKHTATLEAVKKYTTTLHRQLSAALSHRSADNAATG